MSKIKQSTNNYKFKLFLAITIWFTVFGYIGYKSLSVAPDINMLLDGGEGGVIKKDKNKTKNTPKIDPSNNKGKKSAPPPFNK